MSKVLILRQMQNQKELQELLKFLMLLLKHIKKIILMMTL
ncbi:hypothetical protein J2Z76_000638 [Sedimentibacter acidaminivorans]|uniref:Uncharacterized protein n=1 Tax=Sedimentibacter acidaminivorans TaxID=913099 RepID=A0ABS4GAS1_9FIRM|nr:hypothetical protein [Sedimentibacter acidaminivorans]